MRWRTAGTTCSVAWPPTSEVQSRPEREVEPEPGRSRGVRTKAWPEWFRVASQSPGASETSLVVHIVYIPIPKT